jgi:hypothetical protein
MQATEPSCQVSLMSCVNHIFTNFLNFFAFVHFFGVMERSGLGLFEGVPSEVLRYLVTYLDEVDLAKLERCSHKAREIVLQDPVWKLLTMRHFSSAQKEGNSVDLSWKQFYKCCRTFQLNIIAHLLRSDALASCSNLPTQWNLANIE